MYTLLYIAFFSNNSFLCLLLQLITKVYYCMRLRKSTLPRYLFLILSLFLSTGLSAQSSQPSKGAAPYLRQTMFGKLDTRSWLMKNPFAQRLKKSDNKRPASKASLARLSAPVAPHLLAPQKKLLATTTNGTEIWGYISLADSWYDTYGDATNFPQGLYTFVPGSETYTKLFGMTGVDLNGGAAIYDNTFHGISYSVDWSTYDFNLKYYEYSTLDWTPTANNGKAVPANSLELMAACTAVDATDGNKVYGCVSNSDMTASGDYLLGIIDYDNLTTTKIKVLSYPYAAMAIDSKGVLYAITHKGDLVKVDKTTGEETLVGATGLTLSSNFMSAAFDHATNTLYFAATTKDGTSAIYQVDTATGKATAVSTFSDDENITFLYVKDAVKAGAPATVSDLKATFPGEALTGTLSFTIPTTTQGGTTLSGNVTYTVSDNGKTLFQDNAAAGAKISKSLTASAGSHAYSVVVSNNEGSSAVAQVKVWVGRDATQPVTGLNFSVKNGVATLLWTAPLAGAHNGYIDTKALKYDVIRYPDSTVVAKGLTTTLFSETLPKSPYTYYYYQVVADNQGILSEPATSQIECYGEAIVPPYRKVFSAIDSTYTYSVIDNNNDGTTWSYADGAMTYMSMRTYDDGDDWIVTPPFHLKSDRQYHVTFNARCYSESDIEHFGLAIGADAESSISNYTMLVADTSVHSTIAVPVTVTTSVKSEGDYRFAIKAVGNTGLAAFVNAFSVEEGSRFTAPDSVTAMTVTPDANGALKATINMTAPQKAVSGNALSGHMSIKVYRGSISDTTLVKTLTNVAPGQQVAVDDTPLVGGPTLYFAVAANDSGDGLPAQSSAYIGFDTPLPPENIKLKDNLDGSATLSWETPAKKGVHGGAVDMTNLKYNIYSVNDGTPSLLKSGITGNSYNLGDIADNGAQKLTFYAMKAVANDLQSQYGISTMLMTGSPYTLPFKESFANGNATNYWASNIVRGNSNEDFGYTPYYYADNDKGCAFYNSSSKNGEAILSSGKISLTGAAYPYLYFSYYALPGEAMKLKVLVYRNGGDADTLKVIDYSKLNGQDGWRKEMIDMSNYVSAKYILLGFDADIENSKYPVLIDAIKVRDDYQYDLEASLNAPEKAVAGDSITVKVNINNAGTETMSNYMVTLLANGKEVGSQKGNTLTMNADSTFTFKYKVPVTTGEALKVQGRVTSTFDMDDSNDTTTVADISVTKPAYPTVDDLKATKADKGVAISWTSAKGKGNKVTEDFERYDAFAINNVGAWTLFDGDKATTYSVSSTSYNHANGKFAYIVFNPSEVNATDASILPHSGKQYMASMASQAASCPNGHNDDWLISPELSGKAQTVDFWVKSLNDNYGLESYEILYSTTGKDTADFKRVDTAEAPAEAWTEVSYQLPEGAKYFAIRCISEERFMFMVDDVTYEGLPLEVQGYNVYRDGELVASLGADATAYTDVNGTDKSVYNITVVYAAGESALSNDASLNATGITNISTNAVTVRAYEGSIHIDHAQGQRVTVFTLGGAQVAQYAGRETVSCSVAKGAYIVRVGNKVYKLTVD